MCMTTFVLRAKTKQLFSKTVSKLQDRLRFDFLLDSDSVSVSDSVSFTLSAACADSFQPGSAEGPATTASNRLDIIAFGTRHVRHICHMISHNIRRHKLKIVFSTGKSRGRALAWMGLAWPGLPWAWQRQG